MELLKFKVEGLEKGNAHEFEMLVARTHGVHSVETNPAKGLARVMVDPGVTVEKISEHLSGTVFSIAEEPMKNMCLAIDGMSCHSCEIRIEKKLKAIPGVQSVNVDSATGMADVKFVGEAPSQTAIAHALKEEGYKLKGAEADVLEKPERTSLWSVVGFLALAYLFGKLISRFGLLETSLAFGDNTTFFSAFMVGLVAASSSCIAVSGGVMLSTVTAWSASHREAGRMKKFVPVTLFLLGRLISYGALGAVIGTVGASLQLSPLMMGLLTIFAAFYMMVMGLNMLGLAPGFLKRLLPSMPKFLGHKVLEAESSRAFLAPLLLGAATFFLPCGFTQALQLYALTTGSALRSGMLLFAFALGTAPALIMLGAAASFVKGKTANFFYRFAGAAVILIGVWTVQNGWVAAGFTMPQLEWDTTSQLADGADPNVVFDGTTQVIKMKLGIEPAYTPSDEYTVKVGIPVRMEIAGVGTGCRNIFQIPRLGVRAPLNSDVNIVEFTPTKEGDAVFSCSMGMFPGTLHVVKG
jgi:sulfite exporter TauE/SafE/copper chaperone CopZ